VSDIFKDLTPYPAETIKTAIQKIYDDFGIKKTAKASDLEDWFEVKTCTKSIKGKNTFCYMIIRDKIILKSPQIF